MSISIEAGEGPTLIVAGDVDAELPLPFHGIEERFLVASSDGTLLVGRYGYDGSWTFTQAVEGAGLLRIEREGEGPRLILDWDVEWITIAPFAGGCARAPTAQRLPLFPELEAIAGGDAQLLAY